MAVVGVVDPLSAVVVDGVVDDVVASDGVLRVLGVLASLEAGVDVVFDEGSEVAAPASMHRYFTVWSLCCSSATEAVHVLDCW